MKTATITISEREARLLLDILTTEIGVLRLSKYAEVRAIGDETIGPLFKRVNEALGAIEAAR